jgi:nitrogen fixation protein FixH
MTDADFDAMCDHLALPRQRRARGRGTLVVVVLFFSCIVANGVKCKTLAELEAVTGKVRS